MKNIIKKILESAESEMREAVQITDREFLKIFSDQVNQLLLEDIQIDYYGMQSPILHISHFSILDSTVSTVQPFEKNMTAQIEKSISESDQDILTEIKGDKIFLKLSPLTDEIRKRKAEKREKACEKAKKTIFCIQERIQKKLQEESLSEDDRSAYEQEVLNMTAEYCGQICDMNSMYC